MKIKTIILSIVLLVVATQAFAQSSYTTFGSISVSNANEYIVAGDTFNGESTEIMYATLPSGKYILHYWFYGNIESGHLYTLYIGTDGMGNHAIVDYIGHNTVDLPDGPYTLQLSFYEPGSNCTWYITRID